MGKKKKEFYDYDNNNDVEIVSDENYNRLYT